MLDLQRKKEGTSKFSLFLLLIGGAIMFVDNIFARIAGVSVILLAMVTVYARSGTQLNLEAKLFRKYVRLAWIYFGKWERLPDIEYVAIIRMRLSQLKFTPSQAGFTQNENSLLHNYNVNLIFVKDSPLRYLTIYTGDIDDTMQTARDMARTLKTDLYDCSTSQKKWISVDDLEK